MVGGGQGEEGDGSRSIPKTSMACQPGRGGGEEQSQAWLSGRPAAATPFPAYGDLHRQHQTLPAQVPGPARDSRPCQSPPQRGLPDSRKAADAFAQVAAFSPSVTAAL